MEPASIRYKNPGAMWGSALAKKWGATSSVALNDGLGQGNNIADFPTALQGACAQFDLWRTSYCNMALRNAITKWSGGNWSQPYADFLSSKTGISMDVVVTKELLASQKGIMLLQAQAQWEAGKPYPLLSSLDWAAAQKKVFAPMMTKTTKQGAVVATVGTATTTAATAAVKSGSHWGIVVAIVVSGLVGAGIALFLVHRFHKGA